MQVLMDIKGHGYVADVRVPEIEACIERLKVVCEEAGLPLRADLSATNPDPVEPSPPPPTRGPDPDASGGP